MDTRCYKTLAWNHIYTFAGVLVRNFTQIELNICALPFQKMDRLFSFPKQIGVNLAGVSFVS